jgi:hypothetical protein
MVSMGLRGVEWGEEDPEPGPKASSLKTTRETALYWATVFVPNHKTCPPHFP